jgi:hypothetical protein
LQTNIVDHPDDWNVGRFSLLQAPFLATGPIRYTTTVRDAVHLCTLLQPNIAVPVPITLSRSNHGVDVHECGDSPALTDIVEFFDCHTR